MLFNSLSFAIFFPIVTLLYFALPQRFRWLHLLTASCLFYMFFIPLYILILVFTIVIDYFAGILIERNQGGRRKVWLVLSLCANIGVLAVFKYYNFGVENIQALLNAIGWKVSLPLLNLILPIGLSFHTFQAMSYTIEVYRGAQPAERHFGIYALYVLFYPQLVAGPIERPQNLLHQFRELHTFHYERVTGGLKLMAWGIFKKAVIADRAALVVDPVFANPSNFSGPEITAATVLYAYQIYCDFSGYSDIAIGAAQVMGFKLMTNFRQPYFARSISEFWQRWHISLSTWFRDYLYIPLGGNRVSAWRRQRNLLIVFLISGLWHGASWTFVVWGALHGVYLIASLWTRNWRARLVEAIGLNDQPWLHRGLQTLLTFTLVCIAWIFFRASNMTTALYMIRLLFADWPAFSLAKLGMEWKDTVILLGAIGLLEAVQLLQQFEKLWDKFTAQPLYLRWAGYYALSYLIMTYGRFGAQQFIYFQF
jgi:alginate O-acetyltransferase complex protein AlgI